MIDQKFGKLTVIKYEYSLEYRKYYLCKCDCGNTKVAMDKTLKNGGTKSCGCLVAHNRLTHGMSSSPEHITWTNIKQRCFNKSHPRFKDYGGRGIKVCDRWLESFQNFFEDMGNKPSPTLTIERINNNGNYEPSNCKWATHKEQSRNCSQNRVVKYNGESLCLTDAVIKYSNIGYKTVLRRLNDGWSIEDAIEKPVMKLRRKYRRQQ